MAEAPLFAGPALRRLRKREGLTQSAMAAQLSVSPSYLNLIERGQRPLSARVVMALVERFAFDPRALSADAAIGGSEGLARRFADERFADLGIDREEIAELLAAAPQAAAAFARLYDGAGAGAASHDDDPLSASRREIERWRNHFADLDHAAEALGDEMRLSRGDIGLALGERLRERHQLSVRILPREVLPDALRRLDLHARQVQLSEMLSGPSRNFQLALQLVQLEQRDQIAAIARGAQLDDTARELFARHLAGYFAAALIMPYGRFLRACEATGYDLPVLERRFGVSFEQLAHRLTTLQRVGQRGLPFFMARIDRAGQFSKTFTGASTARFVDAETSCPLWAAHRAFERGGELLTQFVALDAGEDSAGPAREGGWLTMSRVVEGSGAPGEAQFVVVLGIEAVLAGDLAQARGVSLRTSDAQLIGPGCARCYRAHCAQRSLPPQGRRLRFDPVRRGATPFEFGAG